MTDALNVHTKLVLPEGVCEDFFVGYCKDDDCKLVHDSDLSILRSAPGLQVAENIQPGGLRPREGTSRPEYARNSKFFRIISTCCK